MINRSNADDTSRPFKICTDCQEWKKQVFIFSAVFPIYFSIAVEEQYRQNKQLSHTSMVLKWTNSIRYTTFFSSVKDMSSMFLPIILNTNIQTTLQAVMTISASHRSVERRSTFHCATKLVTWPKWWMRDTQISSPVHKRKRRIPTFWRRH